MRGITSSNHLSQCLTVSVAGQTILISIRQVSLVLANLALQTVPHHDESLAGYLNYHGKPVPVYHLAALLKRPIPTYDLNTPIILADLSAGLSAFIVDHVFSVTEINEDNIHVDACQITMPYVAGFLEEETRSAWVLDLEKLLQYHQNDIL